MVRSTLILIFAILSSGSLMAQFYRYKSPDGVMIITDKPITEKGYELVRKFIPPAMREELRQQAEEEDRLAHTGYSGKGSKFQLSREQIAGIVDPIADAYGVDPDLVKAVIEVESARNARVSSNKGALGLMQLIPQTAERFGVKNVWDPHQNVKGGILYLRFLLAYFEGNVDLALAGYNAGENAVDKYGGIPPYKETKGYIKKIRQLYAVENLPYDTSIPHRSKLIADTTPQSSTRVAAD